MNAVLIFVAVFAMPNPADERLTVFTKPMTVAACEAHAEKMRARYAAGGRWAQSYRHFDIRCIGESGQSGVGIPK